MFTTIRTGKRKKKEWKKMVTKVTFVGNNFTRKPPKYERFIRPTGLRFISYIFFMLNKVLDLKKLM